MMQAPDMTKTIAAVGLINLLLMACASTSAPLPAMAAPSPEARPAPAPPPSSVQDVPAPVVTSLPPSAAAKSSGPATRSTPLQCATLQGDVDRSARWGSGWMNLSRVSDFEAGSLLRIVIGGSARMILVRLLPKGQSPDQPAGILGIFTVPSNRVLEVPITVKKQEIWHISVHGSPMAWDFDLGAGNGPASLSSVDYCK